MNRIIYVILILILSCCHHNSNITERLNRADNLLDSQPDSALNIIRNIDEDSLNTKEEKARYGLLLTMALLKTDEEEADIRYLENAIKYYGNSSTPSRETMLTHYALAATSDSTVQKLHEYDKAIELATDPNKDGYIAKAYLNKANIYHKAFSSPDEWECIEKGKEFAIASNDTSLIIHAYLISGIYKTGISDYSQAILEFQKALDLADKSNILDEVPYILNSTAYVSSLGGKHTEAVQLYDSLMKNYPSYLDTNDLCTYAGSLAYIKDFKRAEEILRLLSHEDINENKNDWLYTNAIVEYQKENYKEAFEYLDSTIYFDNKVIREKLDGNLSRQEKLISQIEARNQKELANKRTLIIWLIVGCSLSALALLCVLIYNMMSRHRRRLRAEKERLEEVRRDSEKETEMLMSRLEALDSVNAGLTDSTESLSRHSKEIESQLMMHKQTNEDLKGQLSDRNRILNDLRDSYLVNFRLLHRGIAEFCNDIPSGFSTQAALNVYERERTARLAQYKGEETVAGLKSQLNGLSDNIIDRIADAAGLSEADVNTLVYEICGFNYKSIAELLDTTTSAVATRRTRLKTKLSSVNPALLDELNVRFALDPISKNGIFE